MRRDRRGGESRASFGGDGECDGHAVIVVRVACREGREPPRRPSIERALSSAAIGSPTPEAATALERGRCARSISVKPVILFEMSVPADLVREKEVSVLGYAQKCVFTHRTGPVKASETPTSPARAFRCNDSHRKQPSPPWPRRLLYSLTGLDGPPSS